MGESGGAENVTLQTAQIPSDKYNMETADIPRDSRLPTGAYLAGSNDGNNKFNIDLISLYLTVNLAGDANTPTGGPQGHPNLQPYTVLQWCICVAGIFPPWGGS